MGIGAKRRAVTVVRGRREREREGERERERGNR